MAKNLYYTRGYNDAARSSAFRRYLKDPQLKQLMKELGDAINQSLSDSPQISEVVSRIKEHGYNIFLVLEATIGVSHQSGTTDKVSFETKIS